MPYSYTLHARYEQQSIEAANLTAQQAMHAANRLLSIWSDNEKEHSFDRLTCSGVEQIGVHDGYNNWDINVKRIRIV